MLGLTWVLLLSQKVTVTLRHIRCTYLSHLFQLICCQTHSWNGLVKLFTQAIEITVQSNCLLYKRCYHSLREQLSKMAIDWLVNCWVNQLKSSTANSITVLLSLSCHLSLNTLAVRWQLIGFKSNPFWYNCNFCPIRWLAYKEMFVNNFWLPNNSHQIWQFIELINLFLSSFTEAGY